MPRSAAATPKKAATPSKVHTPSKNQRSGRKTNRNIDILDDIESANSSRRKVSTKKAHNDDETPRKRGRPPASIANTPSKSSARKKDEVRESSEDAESDDDLLASRPTRIRKPSAKLAMIQSELNDTKPPPPKVDTLKVPKSRPNHSIKRSRDPEPTISIKKRKDNRHPTLTRQLSADDLALENHDPITPSKKRPIAVSTPVKIPRQDVSIPIKPLKSLPPPTKVPLRPGEAEAIQFISPIVLSKLAGRRPVPLTHLDQEYTSVHNLVEGTVTAGQGNSLVIIGARGTGKTALVNRVLSDLAERQRDYFHVVRLNGFIQTDDKLALREIWRQLGREMDLEEEAGKSAADTMTMLLALLSHPDEILGDTNGQVAKSVIFVMDEFDLFATHPRQTLLYNLLDIAQARKAPIAVLGVTTVFDVKERLEKRVKSRFSHRYVHIPFAKSQNAFAEICMAALTVTNDELSVEERTQLLRITTETKKPKGKPIDVLADWNTTISTLFADPRFIATFIRPTYTLTRSPSSLFSSFLLPLSSLLTSPTHSIPTLLHPTTFLSLHPHPTLQPPTSSLPLLLSTLSTLALSLLIASARLDVIHGTDLVSFPLAYAEYVTLASQARIQSAASGAVAAGAGTKVWGRSVARGEWETLVKEGLLVPVSENGGAGGMCRVDVRLEEISGAVGPEGLGVVLERWCRQL